MKLLFVVTGFAYGDSIRVESIIDKFLKRDKSNEVIILGYDHSYNYFKNKFRTLEIEGYKFPDYGLEFKTHRFLIKNYYLPFSWITTWRKHKKILKLFDPDLIISDFEPMAILIAKSLNKKCVSVFGYDPLAYKEYNNKNNTLNIQSRFIEKIYENSDYVVIPSFRRRKNFSNINYVNPIMREYKQKRDLMKKLGLKKHPIIIMLGGSDYGLELARKILSLVKKYKEDFIVFGGTKKISKNHFKFKENFLDYLNVSKGIITLAGSLTLSESLALKRPILAFPIKNHVEQQLNAFLVGNYINIGDDNIEKSLYNFITNLNSIQKKLNKTSFKGDGAKQVVNLLYKIKRDEK